LFRQAGIRFGIIGHRGLLPRSAHRLVLYFPSTPVTMCIRSSIENWGICGFRPVIPLTYSNEADSVQRFELGAQNHSPALCGSGPGWFPTQSFASSTIRHRLGALRRCLHSLYQGSNSVHRNFAFHSQGVDLHVAVFVDIFASHRPITGFPHHA
jgi:hypothetical protein